MQLFLMVVAGLFIIVVTTLSLGWWWLQRTLGNVQGFLNSLSSMPPFRIRVLPSAEAPWRNAAVLASLSSSFEALGYETVGDFEIPEMEGLAIRGFRHNGESVLAAIYDHEAVGVFVDLVLELIDGTYLNVTTAPADGIDRPPEVRRVRLDVDLLEGSAAQQLHERMKQEAHGREPILLDGSFEHAFVEAYTREMNWRMRRGGVTAEEIRAEARLAGQKAPSPQAIEIIRSAWRTSIDEFIEEEVRRAWLAQSNMSLADWERERERFVVVHEYSEASDHVEALAWMVAAGTYPEDDDEAADQAWESAKLRLEPAFEGVSPRAGFAAAQRRLPEKRRYESVGSLDTPWPADCYLMPVDERLG